MATMNLTSRQANLSAAGQMATNIETCIASVELACRTVSVELKSEKGKSKNLIRFRYHLLSLTIARSK